LINQRKRKNSFPLPAIDTLIDKTSVSKFFSKLDLNAAYLTRMETGSIPLTAFITPQSEWLMMPFGLTKVTASFQSLMQSLFSHLDFVEVYLDDL
jgi:hypothetical protein